MMNELETQATPEEVRNENLAAPEADANNAVVEEKVTEQPAAEAAAPQEGEAAAEESAQPDMPNYHTLDKEGLIQAVKEILEADRMSAHKEVAVIKQAFYTLRSKETDRELEEFIAGGGEPSAFAAMPDPLEAEFKQALNDFKEKRAAFLAAEEARLEANLQKRNDIQAKLQAIVDDIDNVNLRFQEFQQLQNEFKEIREVTPSADADSWKAYQRVTEQFYDNLKVNRELRDMAFKRNLEMKQSLIREARLLGEAPDVVAAFRRLQDLHARWKDVGPVDKAIRDSIWEEFREASSVVNKRHQDYFMERKATESANEEAKEKLCQKAEEIAALTPESFKDWTDNAKALQDLQAEWRTLGFASRKANNALYARFRAACDDFFSRKSAHFSEMKAQGDEKLKAMEGFCEKAEVLKADFEQAEGPRKREIMEAVNALQQQWKDLGSVPQRQGRALWTRFREACNSIYEQRRKENSESRKAEVANLELKRALLEEIKAVPTDLERSEGIARVRELQDRWQAIGFVPMKQKDKLQSEYREAVNALYDAFNMNAARSRMENFEGRMRNMAGDSPRMSREKEKLVRALEQRRSDLKNYENNMGFFKFGSASGSPLLAELERKASKLREEIAELEEKIKVVDASQEENK